MSYTVRPHRDHWHVDGLPEGDTFHTTTPAIAAVFAFALNAVADGRALASHPQQRTPVGTVIDDSAYTTYDGPTEGLAGTEKTPS